MKLSVIIPTYNSGKNIQSCLCSLRKQSFQNFEVVVVDGNSSDNTLEIVEKSRPYLPEIKIISEPDRGVYDAMNKGINLASGKFLFFLGSDDILFDNEVFNDVVQEVSNRNVDLIYGDVQFLYSKTTLGGVSSLTRLLFEGNICHQGIFYKRSVFDKIGLYNLTYKVWADWEFNIRCFRHTGITTYYFQRVISLYNERDGLSARAKQDEELIKELPLYMAMKLNNVIKGYEGSKEYKLGKVILKPLRYVKRFLSRKRLPLK